MSAVAVIDLGLGNLGSVLHALRRAGAEPHLAAEPGDLLRAERIVLPGVAAFGLGMERVSPFRGALQAALEREVPTLGICLGMQLLFEEGEEDGARPGLGFLPGRVTRLPASVQVPHIGWQKLEPTASSPLFDDGPRGAGWGYFANSYRCEAPPGITCAVVHHGAPGASVPIAAVVQRGPLFGVQHHPEKSAQDGEALLRRFLSR